MSKLNVCSLNSSINLILYLHYLVTLRRKIFVLKLNLAFIFILFAELASTIAMAPYLDGDILSERNGATTKDPHMAQVHRNTDKFEPVAIVGLSFEVPQDVTSSDAFWKLLMSKGNTATEFPKNRLAISAMYHPDRNRRGQVSMPYPRRGPIR